MQKRKIGWTVYIVECADGTFHSGMSDNLEKRLRDIGMLKGVYFSKHPERLPVRIVFKEEGLAFDEAFAKRRYLKTMNRKQKIGLIEKNHWPMGGTWREYVRRQIQLSRIKQRG